jgi:poly(A) polymerase
MYDDTPPHTLAYRLGAELTLDILALRAALGTREIDPEQAEQTLSDAAQRFPVTAADLMPALEGPALGDRLKQLESLWLASRFTLSKEALLADSA